MQVKEESKSNKSVRKVYQNLINEDEGGPRHAIMVPRSQNQV